MGIRSSRHRHNVVAHSFCAGAHSFCAGALSSRQQPFSFLLASLIPLFLLLFLPLFLSACTKTEGAPRDQAPAPIPVQTITLEATRMPRTIAAVGSLKSPHTTQVTADRGGKVVFLDIPEGQEVEAGHVLARIDPDEAQAAVDVVRARYQNAQETLARLKQLPAKARSQQALDDARASVRATKGELDEARTVLRKMTIQAPFTGRLGLRRVSLGAYLEPGDAVVRITQTQPLHLVFSLPQQHVPEIQNGQVVRGVAGNCDSTFTATVSVIDPFLDPETRSVTIQAIVPNEDGSLLPGMAAALRLEIADVADALLVPAESIIRQGSTRLVYMVQDHNIVTSRPVVLGQFSLQRVEVLSGLHSGDTIVVSGHQKLRPGAVVQPQPYAPIDNPNLELGASTALLTACHF